MRYLKKWFSLKTVFSKYQEFSTQQNTCVLFDKYRIINYTKNVYLKKKEHLSVPHTRGVYKTSRINKHSMKNKLPLVNPKQTTIIEKFNEEKPDTPILRCCLKVSIW